jgi:hypothetical protein
MKFPLLYNIVLYTHLTAFCPISTSFLSSSKRVRTVKLNIHLYLVADLRMRGALTPLLIVRCTDTDKLEAFRHDVNKYRSVSAYTISTLKADSHIACRAHAFPLPCRNVKVLECVFPIWFTQCGRVWITFAMQRPCHALTMPFFSKSNGKDTFLTLIGTAWQGNGMGAACYVWIDLESLILTWICLTREWYSL